MKRKLKIFLVVLFCITVASVAFSEPNIAILWEKEIAQADRSIKSFAVKVDQQKNTLRMIGASYIYRSKETPRLQSPELFEYRLNLKDNKSEMKTLTKMESGDTSIRLPKGGIKDSRLIDGNIVLVRRQYKSKNFQELTIGSDWKVKSRRIPGLTSSSIATLGACMNDSSDVFLCGNSGYIRKVKSDGTVAWDINYKSKKGQENTFRVAFSESENMLVAFGCSFESDTKFSSKDSSLWLANLDSNGNFIAKKEFEGIANFGKFPSFCLSKSDNPIVIYDNDAEMKGYKIYISKFSKDLKTKIWTKHIFERKDMMVREMSLTPLENDHTLATLSTFGTKGNYGRNLYFYILDSNGSIVNQAVFEDMWGLGFLETVAKDKIFFVTDGRNYDKDKYADVSKLICFKIYPY